MTPRTRSGREGLITVVHGGGSGICNRYTLVTNPDVQGAEACNANGDTQAVTFSPAENGDKPSRKRRRGRLRSLALAHRKPVTPSVIRTDEPSEQTKRPAAKAASMLVGVDGQAELLRTLTRDWAIAEHNAPKLVRANLRLTEPWTVRIRAIDTRVREGGGRTGAVDNTDASLRMPIRFGRVACYSYDCVARAAD